MWPRVLTGVLCVMRNVCFLFSGQIFLVQKMKVFPIFACSIFNKVLTETPQNLSFLHILELTALPSVCASIQWRMLYFILAAMTWIRRVALFRLWVKLASCIQRWFTDRTPLVSSVQEPTLSHCLSAGQTHGEAHGSG